MSRPTCTFRALAPLTDSYFLLGLTANIPNGGTSNFGTLMTRGFGFNTLNTTLLQIPYGLSQTLFIVAAIWINHKTAKYNIRTYLMAAVTCIPVFGFAMMAYGQNQGTKLLGYCESLRGTSADDRLYRCFQRCLLAQSVHRHREHWR